MTSRWMSIQIQLGWIAIVGVACASPVELGPFAEPTLPLPASSGAESQYCSDGQPLRATGRLAMGWEGGVFQPSGTAAVFVVTGETDRFERTSRGLIRDSCYFVDIEGRCEFEPEAIPSDWFVVDRVIHARVLSAAEDECIPAFDDIEPW